LTFNNLKGRSNFISPLLSFSVIWTGYITPPESGDYRFRGRTDDGFWLYVGDLNTVLVEYPGDRVYLLYSWKQQEERERKRKGRKRKKEREKKNWTF